MNKRKRYRAGSNTGWTAEINGIKVFSKTADHMTIIPYPEAALWDLLQQKYSTDQIIPIISAFTGKDRQNVEKMIENNIHKWLEDGLIQQYG